MRGRTTNTTLLEGLAAGNGSPAWGEFCERYGDLVRGFARRQGLSESDADDVLQDVLVALTTAMSRYDPSLGRFRGYLKTVTLHVIFKRFRQKSPAARPVGIDTSVEADSADAEIDGQWEAQWREYHVSRAMETIEAEFGEADREAFELYALGGKDAGQTAQLLGISVDRVYQAKSRITRRLAELIEQQVAEEG